MALCECGCGQETAVATKTRASQGHVKGQPLRFLHGHHLRLHHHDPRPYVADRNRARTRHGHTRDGKRSPTWLSWRSMHDRCSNPASDAWEWYGGRGITACARWASFEAFLADMGERPEGQTLDRIDPDRGYEPDNCRWATWHEQAVNRRPRRKAEPQTHCNRGHEFAGENLYIAPDGRRQCRACNRLRASERT